MYIVAILDTALCDVLSRVSGLCWLMLFRCRRVINRTPLKKLLVNNRFQMGQAPGLQKT
jgi:hypothetical protein